MPGPSREDIQRAEALGRLAARATREGVAACPYEANGDPGQRELTLAFVRAYFKADGRASVDYGDVGQAGDRSARLPGGGHVRVSRGGTPDID